MGKFLYNVKNAFKSKETREIEAKIEFNRNKSSFMKYNRELDVSIKNFTKMAKDAELSGNHANAVSCVKFVSKLQKTQGKVQGLIQRFEMMNSMQQLSGVMSKFMSACAKMGYSMDTTIDLKGMMQDSVAMEKALGKLDAMTEQMDMVFDTIDTGLGDLNGVSSAEENDAEAAALLDSIMGRHNIENYAEASGTAEAAPAAAEPANADSDGTDEMLRKMMEDLKS